MLIDDARKEAAERPPQPRSVFIPPSKSPAPSPAVSPAPSPVESKLEGCPDHVEKHPICRRCHDVNLGKKSHGVGKCVKCTSYTTCPTKKLSHDDAPEKPTAQQLKKAEKKELHHQFEAHRDLELGNDALAAAIHTLCTQNPELYSEKKGTQEYARACGVVAQKMERVHGMLFFSNNLADWIAKEHENLKLVKQELKEKHSGDPVEQQIEYAKKRKQELGLDHPDDVYLEMLELAKKAKSEEKLEEVELPKN